MEGLLSYEFLQRALLMAVLSGAVCGGIGVFVVLWRMSLVGMCIAHASFAGTLFALWLGAPPLAGGLSASLCAAAAVGPLAERPGFSLDTAMGVVFSVVMSLAMIALGLLPGARTEGLSLIWGNLLTVTRMDIYGMGATGGMLLVYVIVFFKEIQAILGQRQSAEASGVPVRCIYYLCLMLMGVVVAFALKVIGGLLIYALIVTPAATALQMTYSLRTMFWLAAVMGAVASVLGLWLSYYLAVPMGAAIVLVATVFLGGAMCLSPKRRERVGSV